MDVMTAYVQDLSDADLVDLAAKNLVTSQSRIVAAEVAHRGLTIEEV